MFFGRPGQSFFSKGYLVIELLESAEQFLDCREPSSADVERLHDWSVQWKRANFDKVLPRGLLNIGEVEEPYLYGREFKSFLGLVLYARNNPEELISPLPNMSLEHLLYASVIIQVGRYADDMRALEATRFFFEEFEKCALRGALKNQIRETKIAAAKKPRRPELNEYLDSLVRRLDTRRADILWERMLIDFENHEEQVRLVFDDQEKNGFGDDDPKNIIFCMKKSFRTGERVGSPMTFGYEALRKRLRKMGRS